MLLEIDANLTINSFFLRPKPLAAAAASTTATPAATVPTTTTSTPTGMYPRQSSYQHA